MRRPCAGHIPNGWDLSLEACFETPKGELNGRVDRVQDDFARLMLDLQHEPKQPVGGAVALARKQDVVGLDVRQSLGRTREDEGAPFCLGLERSESGGVEQDRVGKQLVLEDVAVRGWRVCVLRRATRSHDGEQGDGGEKERTQEAKPGETWR
jgi:hypothetical protein